VQSARLYGLVACFCAASPCDAALVPIVPGDTQIGLTVYAFGVFAQSGHFTRFTGTLQLDPDQLASCQIRIKVEAASLDMGVPGRTHMGIGPGLLDASTYPELLYSGACDPNHGEGDLTMHGVTRHVRVTEGRSGNRISATFSLRRQDYGIKGMPGLIGNRIGVVFSVDLPPALAAKLPALPPP
jgi:polyisoprenoid-binding protein YceI